MFRSLPSLPGLLVRSLIVGEIHVRSIDLHHHFAPSAAVPQLKPCSSADDDYLLLQTRELSQRLWENYTPLSIEL